MKELTQEEKEIILIQKVVNVLQSIEIKDLDIFTIERLMFAKGMLEGFVSIKNKFKK